jgi:UDP-glucose 4-epimerase
MSMNALDFFMKFEKITYNLSPYDIVTRREGDTAISYAKPDLANITLYWKTKRTLESACESAWKFNEDHAL